jgi:curved DNA-binding protein CbpA
MNYYDILKVSKSASQQEIRDSYKSLIKKYHPDIYTGSHDYAEKITKELNDAYSILSNEESRRNYDLTLEEPQETIIYTKPSTYSNNFVQAEKEIPKETFEQKMKEKIYTVIDDKTKNMSNKSKLLMIITVIFIALLFTAFAIQDFINIMYVFNK